MTSLEDYHGNHNAAGNPPPSNGARHHTRTKSGVLKSFIHRRNNSDGSALPSSFSTPNGYPTNYDEQQQYSADMRVPHFSRPDRTLGEIQNHQQSRSQSPSKDGSRSRSPTKNPFSTISIKSMGLREADKVSKEGQLKYKENESGVKPKKTKSATNLAGLLSRPKSLKNLHKLMSDEDTKTRVTKDKENRTPPSSLSQDAAPPPIYAQFAKTSADRSAAGTPNEQEDPFSYGYASNGSIESGGSGRFKPRPKSYQPQATQRYEISQQIGGSGGENSRYGASKTPRDHAVYGLGSNSKPSTPDLQQEQFMIAPEEVDTHLESLLDRRNIPEHQRYKMRNLAQTIKMEFIRQDWAESRQASQVNLHRPGTNDSDASMNAASDTQNSTSGKDQEGSKPRSRSRGFTLSKGKNKDKNGQPSSPVKEKKGQGTLGRHFRSKSTESITSERPPSAGSGAGSGSGSGILSKLKLGHGPGDYVGYLRKVQKPELVEVGKLHKLRLLLRNETVAWIEEFIKAGGMQEIVGLLHRIMEVEWREEHEDALLHENLLCLKALCTTALALQYIHSIQATLFPALLAMLFDPEKKGPSEFTTRNIITSVLFTYIQSASPEDRVSRTKTVIGHLRDPEPKDEEKPLGFVMDMRRERPYRVWCKEVVSVTKEVFWIFLHHLNIVALPKDKDPNYPEYFSPSENDVDYLYRHFPAERPPVPAAPYVGGVEWDATNYLASHLDLLNAVLACTPTAAERNNLRDLLKISGWERCMGGSMRLCKEKFYPGVHDALRTWVAAAAEDGWDVRDVRYGPPAECKSPKKAPGSPKKKVDPAPKLDMPKLDFVLDGQLRSPGVVSPGLGPKNKSEQQNESWLD